MSVSRQSPSPDDGQDLGPWLRVRRVELEWLDAQIAASSGAPESARGLHDRLESARNKLALVERTAQGPARRRALDEFQNARRALLDETRAAVQRWRRRTARDGR